VDELLGSEQINYVHQILKNGTGAAKQLAVFEKTNDITKVVDFITDEFTKGLVIRLSLQATIVKIAP
jgi:carboxylate-amine ligase